MQAKINHSFESFIIQKWSDKGLQDLEEQRKSAYKNVRKKIRGKNVAESSTIQSWFGIKKRTTPDREHAFRLALALELSPSQLEEYLQKGLLMPGVQINDYQETIYLYGLENHLTWEECQGMIHVFEYHMNQDVVLEQKTHTNELWASYEEWNGLDKEHFLKKMMDKAGMFKGYGRTALKYFTGYKNEILKYVREEAALRLQQELQGSGFYQWARENDIVSGEYKDAIRRYVKNETRRKNPRITKEKWKEIEHYYWKAYGIQERNTDFIEQMRPGVRWATVEMKESKNPYIEREKFQLPDSVRLFSKNYLSRLLLVGMQTEKQIRLSYGLAQIRYDKDDEKIPVWLMEYLKDEGILKSGQRELLCAEARKLLEKQIKNQKKRRRLVQREDLLPLILGVAQNRYNALWQRAEEYDREKAKRFFVDLANVTLTACHMAPINEEYELDSWLLNCYDEEEMYSFVEMLEQNQKRE